MKLHPPMIPPRPYTPALIKRFLSYVFHNRVTGCWIWDGGKDKDGYGKFKIHGHDLKAHRVSFALFGGNLPAGYTVNHKQECLNRSCVNPEHLEAMLWGDNCADANRRRGKSVLEVSKESDELVVEVELPDVPYVEIGTEYLPPYFEDDSPCPF